MNSAKCRHLIKLLAVLLVCAYQPDGTAAWSMAPGFEQVTTVPANYQNSTVLSVDTSSQGVTLGSNGRNITSITFDGSQSVATDLGLAGASLRFDQQDRPNVLRGNPNGPGSVWRSNGISFSELVEFGASQHYPRALAFDGEGNFVVSGTYGSINDPGWIRRYDAAGNVLLNIDISQAPIGLAFDGSDKVYVGTFDGAVLTLVGSELKEISSLLWDRIGNGAGYVESFAVDRTGNLFLGLALGVSAGQNFGAIVRLSELGRIDTLALGYGDSPVDMTFSPNNDLLVAGFNPDTGSNVVKITGDFAGKISSPGTAPLALLTLPIISIRRPARILRTTALGRDVDAV